MNDTRAHYERLAATYNANWEYSEEYLTWMTESIARHLDVEGARSLLDIGGGTGIYSDRLRQLMSPAARVLCLDPSQAMLDEAPEGIETVLASADSAVQALVDRGAPQVERMLLKEVVHHFDDLAATLGHIAEALAPGGRMVIALLPPTLDYPLFRAAHEVFESRQPHYDDIAEALRGAHLQVTVAHEAFELEIPVPTYVDMVQDRYMSLLSAFDDTQLTTGVREMKAASPESGVYRFADHFVFVTGSRDG